MAIMAKVAIILHLCVARHPHPHSASCCTCSKPICPRTGGMATACNLFPLFPNQRSEPWKFSRPQNQQATNVQMSILSSFSRVPNSPMSPPVRMKKVTAAQMEKGGVSAESARCIVALGWRLERIYVLGRRVDKPVW